MEKLSTADGKNSTDKMSSSINSLRDLRLANGPSTRSESPSPFTSSSYFATSSTSSSPTSSGILPPAGSSKPEPDFHATVDILKRDHLAAARKSVVNDQVLLLELEAEIEKDCESLRSFLCAAQVGFYLGIYESKSIWLWGFQTHIILVVNDRLSTKSHRRVRIRSLGSERNWLARLLPLH